MIWSPTAPVLRSTIAFALVSAVALTEWPDLPPSDPLAREAARAVQPGMPVPQAVARMKAIHYRCGPDSFGLSCTRRRGVRILASCIQRVNLHMDRAGARVERVQVRKPACTGL